MWGFLFMCIFVTKAKEMKQHTYRILLNKEPEGGFTVTVPALPGCITYGETMDEAIQTLKKLQNFFLRV